MTLSASIVRVRADLPPPYTPPYTPPWPCPAPGPDAPPSYQACRVDAAWAALRTAEPGPRRESLARDLVAELFMLERFEPGSDALRLRAPWLLEASVVAAMTAWAADRRPGLDRLGVARSRWLWDYVPLLTRLIDDGVLPRDRVTDALMTSRMPDLPPFLLQFATFSRPTRRAGHALAQLVRALLPTPGSGSAEATALRLRLLETKDRRGLPANEKYADFFSRLVRDGRLIGPQGKTLDNEGALACLCDLAAMSLMPGRREVAHIHSWQRARKFERAGHDAKRHGAAAG